MAVAHTSPMVGACFLQNLIHRRSGFACAICVAQSRKFLDPDSQIHRATRIPALARGNIRTRQPRLRLAIDRYGYVLSLACDFNQPWQVGLALG